MRRPVRSVSFFVFFLGGKERRKLTSLFSLSLSNFFSGDGELCPGGG